MHFRKIRSLRWRRGDLISCRDGSPIPVTFDAPSQPLPPKTTPRFEHTGNILASCSLRFGVDRATKVNVSYAEGLVS